MTDIDHLTAAVCLDPAADLPRLVLADRLDELGGEDYEARAELIRAGCELARLTPPRAVTPDRLTLTRDEDFNRRAGGMIYAFRDVLTTHSREAMEVGQRVDVVGREWTGLDPTAPAGVRFDDMVVTGVTAEFGFLGPAWYDSTLVRGEPWADRARHAELAARHADLVGGPDGFLARCRFPLPAELRIARGFVNAAWARQSRTALAVDFGPFCRAADRLTGWPLETLVVLEPSFLPVALRHVHDGGEGDEIWDLVRGGGADVASHWTGIGVSAASVLPEKLNAFCLDYVNKLRLRQIAAGTFRSPF